MPKSKDSMQCTAGCNVVLSRRTICRHLRYGCPGTERREGLNRTVQALRASARERTPCTPAARQHGRQRSPSSTPPPSSFPRPSHAEEEPVPPPSPIQPPTDPCTPDLDSDARLRHMDFALDTPSAGPSSRSPSPHRFVSYSTGAATANVPIQPDGTMPPWCGDLPPEDLLSQELFAELAREGGKPSCYHTFQLEFPADIPVTRL